MKDFNLDKTTPRLIITETFPSIIPRNGPGDYDCLDTSSCDISFKIEQCYQTQLYPEDVIYKLFSSQPDRKHAKNLETGGVGI